jgi:hypothetical protein
MQHRQLQTFLTPVGDCKEVFTRHTLGISVSIQGFAPTIHFVGV